MSNATLGSLGTSSPFITINDNAVLYVENVIITQSRSYCAFNYYGGFPYVNNCSCINSITSYPLVFVRNTSNSNVGSVCPKRNFTNFIEIMYYFVSVTLINATSVVPILFYTFTTSVNSNIYQFTLINSTFNSLPMSILVLLPFWGVYSLCFSN